MKGLITWFVDNSVAANLLMFILLVGGGMALLTTHQEEFPNIDPDIVRVSVPYLGAAPEEVERSVCVRIEEAVESVQGIDKMTAVANEGSCTVTIEVADGFDSAQVSNDIKGQVDGINTFPVETEKPIVSKFVFRGGVMQIVLLGDVGERALKQLGQAMRDDIVDLPGISQAEIAYTRPFEISVEVSEQMLRRHNLTMAQVADAIRRTSVDMPGGSIKTEGGEILVRTEGQVYTGRELEDVVVLTRADGTRLFLSEIATIVDAFEEGDLRARLDGRPAVMVKVFRVGDEDIISMARTLRAYLDEYRTTMPEGVDFVVWQDESEELRVRLDTLTENARNGLILVLAILALFLRFRLAVWVAAGIPIALLGGIMIFPFFGISISTITVMAFILILGIVVDDAIVVGERIYAHELDAESRRHAAIDGTYEVSIPVIFGVLTTMATFLPLLLGTGRIGEFFAVIGYVVIICLFFSIVESQLILPVHLAHRKTSGYLFEKTAFVQGWIRFQSKLQEGLERFAQEVYRPMLERAMRGRYVTASLAVAALIVVGGLLASGRVSFQFFPSVEGDRIYATLTMPEGVPVEVTSAAVERLERAAEQLRTELDADRPDGSSMIQHMLSSVGTQIGRGGGPPRPEQPGQSHFAEVAIALPPYDERGDVSVTTMANRWRELTGPIPDAVELSFSAAAFTTGEAINFELTGRDVDELRMMATELRGEIARFSGVYDVSDSFRSGKQEIKLALKPAARTLGLTMNDLASQVRQAFYGLEVQRVQRGVDDVRIMVRYPEDERRSIGNLEDMRIRTSEGIEVPFASVAQLEIGRGFSRINRKDGERIVNVTAEVDRATTTPEKIISAINESAMPALLQKYPGVSVGLGGEQEERASSVASLGQAMLLALIIIYALLAIPLKSYLQPFVIMSVIPFGAIGAITGHYIMGEPLVFFSMLGIVALSGVVVNASLVLVDYVNRRRREGADLWEAVSLAGVTRFRAILLTSSTTFIGLAPLIANSNWATAFVIPMAISLAFGVLFATVITLFLVPALYLILEDFYSLLARIRQFFGAEPQAVEDEQIEAI
ncbi:MAG: efflux RND transporter permease subunit [Pseudomonadales bacterium]|jgi:multidrug efflux pump subunit AcrB|nr:efflux RND transporter permease subunit [Pseudomonadales bacterium]